MRTTRVAATLAALALVTSAGIAGCSSADSQSGDSQSTEQSQSHDADAPQVDRDPTEELPEISGAFGEVPEITPIDTEPPSVITSKVLESTDKDGARVDADDILSVNYAGFLWDGTPFDSSFGRGTPATFSLNAVIQGWKYGLADTRVGDRVLLVVPPQYGYGDSGQGEIPPNSTLVFVVDVLAAFGSDTSALEGATLTESALPDGLTVEGDLGVEPTIAFESGSTAPEEEQNVVIAEGDGAVITAADTVVYNYVGSYWGTSDVAASTWQSGPQVLEAGDSLFLGEHVGSRIAMIFPGDGGNQPAMVMVVDILAAYAP